MRATEGIMLIESSSVERKMKWAQFIKRIDYCWLYEGQLISSQSDQFYRLILFIKRTKDEEDKSTNLKERKNESATTTTTAKEMNEKIEKEKINE